MSRDQQGKVGHRVLLAWACDRDGGEHAGRQGIAEAPRPTNVLAMDTPDETKPEAEATDTPAKLPKEIGGPKGPEPTRYGDWEVKGRCTDF